QKKSQRAMLVAAVMCASLALVLFAVSLALLQKPIPAAPEPESVVPTEPPPERAVLPSATPRPSAPTARAQPPAGILTPAPPTAAPPGPTRTPKRKGTPVPSAEGDEEEEAPTSAPQGPPGIVHFVLHPAANVTVDSNPDQQISDAFVKLPSGSHRLLARADGY